MQNISVSINNFAQNVQTWKFPGGEMGVRLGDCSEFLRQGAIRHEVDITLNFRSNDDLFVLAQIMDAISQWRKNSYVTLRMPYVPYARQDRRMTQGEANGVKVVGNFINSLGFDSVIVTDPHSDVVGAVFNNLTIIEQHKAMKNLSLLISSAKTVLVSPDAGALKKVYKVANTIGTSRVITADKVRDVMSGNIIDTVVNSTMHIGTDNFLVVDDIIDGGGTFLELAKKLRPLTDGKLQLCATHGIFSKGYDDLLNAYDDIFVVNHMNDVVPTDLRFHII